MTSRHPREIEHKVRAYELLASLNQAFAHITADLQGLQDLAFFRRKFLRHFQVMVEEARACICFELVETLHAREQEAWAHFGRLSERWEKQFRDPDDVLLEAQQLMRKRRTRTDKRRGKGGKP